MFSKIFVRIKKLGRNRLFSRFFLLLVAFIIVFICRNIFLGLALVFEIALFDFVFSNGRKVYIKVIDQVSESSRVQTFLELSNLSLGSKGTEESANRRYNGKLENSDKKKKRRVNKGYGWTLISIISLILILTFILEEFIKLGKNDLILKIKAFTKNDYHSLSEKRIRKSFPYIIDPPLNFSISEFSAWLIIGWFQRTIENAPKWDSRNYFENNTDNRNIRYTEVDFDTFFNFGETDFKITENLSSIENDLKTWKENTNSEINNNQAEFGKSDRISVVIPVFNEDEFISRTIIYTIESTPKTLLGEIIVVDDFSKISVIEILEKQLPDEYKKYVRVIRIMKSQGLIRSKIIGADAAFGPNIFFLDGHCRPKPGWSEALVRSIRENYKRIVCPIVQSISDKDWSDLGTAGAKMMIEWNFEFHWYDDGLKEVPIASGGILMITKRWWEESGKYDPGMLFWGGENIEQSFRVWLCGGEIHVVRNSLVGHIFDRKNVKERNNDFEYKKLLVDNMNINHLRTAVVWLSEQYYELYFKNFHVLGRSNIQNIDGIGERLAIKHKLSCKPFKWFVDKFRPAFERQGELHNNFHHIQHVKSKLCLSIKNKQINNKSLIYRGNNNKEIPMTVIPNDVSKYNQKTTIDYDIIILEKCNIDDESQKWSFILGNRMLYNHLTKRCLDKVESIQSNNDTNNKYDLEVDSETTMEINKPLLYECDWNLVMRARNINQFWSWDEESDYGVIINWDGQEHLSNITGGVDEFIVPKEKKFYNDSYCLFSNIDLGDYQGMSLFYKKCKFTNESEELLFKKIWKQDSLG
ncbi:membrane-associated protein with a family 1 glycosyltransferase domain and a ricin domain [Cryptosporidium ryanae]|uniref:membrane-associated protein with a family 1 glycosyltransferase domain and a ricin domain n=1 Tax=Cryptosporidium ryanae TaxID=515981 RepID=UPI00351A6A1F|nr:membrane-associated protein with a family 1 glycosyltransferase domain and a ricin domain [Cryptosporidium ryanae]